MKNGLTFMEWRPKMAIFQFFLPPGKLIEVNFFLVSTRKKLWYATTTSENFIKIQKFLTTYNLVTLLPNWKVKIFTTSLIKSWSYQFLSLIDLKGIKKFIIASAKNFWPWRPGRLQSGREHFTWFWLYTEGCYTTWPRRNSMEKCGFSSQWSPMRLSKKGKYTYIM